MRPLAVVIASGLVVLLLGFAVGIEPHDRGDHSCGSVLSVTTQGQRTHDYRTRPECRPERAGGGWWLATWGGLGLGGALLMGGWTAFGEGERDPRRPSDRVGSRRLGWRGPSVRRP